MLKINHAILFASILSVILVMSLTAPAYADVLAPKKQVKIGISSDKVICDTGLFKVIREGKNSPACVKPDSVKKLVENGWAKPIDEAKLKDFITKLSSPAGKINKVIVTPIKSDLGKLSPKVSVGSYDYVFEVCAVTQSLVSPEVLITSDSETKRYELVETVAQNSCVTSATIIKAASPDSISATLVSKGDISQKIQAAAAKVDSLRMELNEVKKTFGKEATEANKQLGNKIIDLRKQLNDARADLQRMYFVLYTPTKSNLQLDKLTFSGTPITGYLANKISVLPSVASPNTFDVVFEACAGEEQVRVPVIMISSDKESVNVKLGDKIAPKTCQFTSAKIGATDSESITVNVAGNADSSNKITQLEKKIDDLTKQLVSEKESMKTLVHDPNRAEDFNEQLTMKVESISKLRSDIISAKGELSRLLLQIYR